MPTKMREFSWRERDRNSQIANIMYPNLADPTTQKQMLARASEDGRPQNAERLRQRMGVDKPKPNPNPASVDYSKVPGLIPTNRR